MGYHRYNAHLATGDADTITAGNQVDGTTLHLGTQSQKVSGLTALVTVDAETNTLTMTAKWQGSNDDSSWDDIANGSQNAAGVALATGTAGADAAVTKAIPAPDALYGYQYGRMAIVIGVATGNAADTYSIGYTYRQHDAD